MSGSGRRMIGIIIASLICLSSLTMTLFIDSYAYEDAADTLTLVCRKDGIILDGMKWKLYRVGDRKGDSFELNEALSKYPIPLDNIFDDEISSITKTIESYAIADELPAVSYGETDENGELRFTGLTDGLYLASGSAVKKDGYMYLPNALLIDINDNDDLSSYEAYPKSGRIELTGKAAEYSVKNIWVDSDNSYSTRPLSVTVDIICNGRIVDTVTLNEGNNWEYHWTDPEVGNDWRVVERGVPVKYSVLIDHNEVQYVITNIYDPKIITDNGEDTSVSTTAASSAVKVNNTVKKADDKPEKLPQTGQDWISAIVLALSGFFMLAVGAMIKEK